MADISEFRGKTPDELKDLSISLKKELFNLRFLAASGESPNTARFRQVRRDVARVKTLLNDPAAALTAPAAKKAKAPKAEKIAQENKEPKAKKSTSKKKASGA